MAWDNGGEAVGIHPDPKYSQAEVREPQRYGRGLSITRKFAELLGGNIGVESEVGKGQHVYGAGAG